MTKKACTRGFSLMDCRIVELERLGGTSSKQGHLEWATQHPVHSCLEYLQGGRPHKDGHTSLCANKCAENTHLFLEI